MSMGTDEGYRKNHTVVMSLTVTRLMFMKVKITRLLLRREKEQEDRGHKCNNVRRKEEKELMSLFRSIGRMKN